MYLQQLKIIQYKNKNIFKLINKLELNKWKIKLLNKSILNFKKLWSNLKSKNKWYMFLTNKNIKSKN